MPPARLLCLQEAVHALSGRWMRLHSGTPAIDRNTSQKVGSNELARLFVGGSRHGPSHPVSFLTKAVPDKTHAVKHRPLCRKLSWLSQLWQSASSAAELCRNGLKTWDLRFKVCK